MSSYRREDSIIAAIVANTQACGSGSSKSALMDELYDACAQMSKLTWGAEASRGSEKARLPIDLCKRVAGLLRQAARNAVESAALGVLKKIFGAEDQLVQRLLNVVEFEVHDLAQGEPMIESGHALGLLSALIDLAPGFMISSHSELASHLIDILLLGTESQLQGNLETSKLKPIHDFLMQEQLSRSLPGSLSTLISARIHGLSEGSPDGGQPCSSLGHRLAKERPTDQWLNAAGKFATEVLDYFDSRDVKGIDRKKDIATLSALLGDIMGLMQPGCQTEASGCQAGASGCTALSERGGPRSVGNLDTDASNASIALAPPPLSLPVRDMIELLIDFAGDISSMVSKLARILEDNLYQLLEATQLKNGKKDEPSSGKLHCIACLIAETLKRDGADAQTLANSALPGILRCIIQAVDLPLHLRRAVRPLLDVVLGTAFVCDAASQLFSITKNTTFETPFSNKKNMLFATGCLACEIEDSISRGQGSVEKVYAASTISQALAVMQHVQWLACNAIQLQGDAGPNLAELLEPTVSAPPLHKGRGRPPGKTAPRKKTMLEVLGKRRPADVEIAAPPSSSKAIEAPSSDPEDFSSQEESEDIKTSSSGSDSNDDNCSDLEDFVDVSHEANSYGLTELDSLPSGSAAPKTMEKFLGSELVDNYQEQCQELLKMPCPSIPSMEMSKRDASMDISDVLGIADDDSTLKRRKIDC